MHAIAEVLGRVMGPLTAAASWVSACFKLACGLPSMGFYAVATVVVASLGLAIACSAWAVVERTRSLHRRHDLLARLRRARVALRYRDALIGTFREAVVILRAGGGTSLSFRGAGRLLQNCLAGPEGASLARAINGVVDGGKPFSLQVRTIGICAVKVRGQRVGDSTAIFLTPGEAAAAHFALPDGEHERTAQIRKSETVPGRSQNLRATAQVLHAPPRRTQGPNALEALSEAAIVVGPDGRLERYNTAFTRQWSFQEDELRGRPHLTALAARSSKLVGADAIWDIVASGAMAPDPTRYGDWGPLVRGDGRPVSLVMSRALDGGTVVIFADRKRESAPSPAANEQKSRVAA
jgi:hypothetical protein